MVWLLTAGSLPPPGGFLGLNGVTYYAVVYLLSAEPSCWPRKFFSRHGHIFQTGLERTM